MGKEKKVASEEAEVLSMPPAIWTVDGNEQLLIMDEEELDKRESALAPLTGYFVPDFVRNCHLLGVTPHPQLVQEGAEDAPEDSPIQTTVKLAGWKLDMGTMEALSRTVPICGLLHTINLWHANLSAQAIVELSRMIEGSTIQKLFLDFNPLPVEEAKGEAVEVEPTEEGEAKEGEVFGGPENPFCTLINSSSPLVLLSLRGNNIDSDVAIQMFDKLKGECSSKGGDRKYTSPNLLGLTLWGNTIGDEAMPALASTLLVNTRLATLSLAKNNISDSGLEALADAFQAPVVDKDDVKKYKALGVNCSKGGSKQFRDPNTALRNLSVGHNLIRDDGCNVLRKLFVAEQEEDAAAAGKKGKDGKKPAKDKKESGKECKLEKIELQNNPFSEEMHVLLATEETEGDFRFGVQELPEHLRPAPVEEQAES